MLCVTKSLYAISVYFRIHKLCLLSVTKVARTLCYKSRECYILQQECLLCYKDGVWFALQNPCIFCVIAISFLIYYSSGVCFALQK